MRTTEHKSDKRETTHKAEKVFPRVGLFSCVSFNPCLLLCIHCSHWCYIRVLFKWW